MKMNRLQKQEILDIMKQNNIKGKFLISINELKCKTNDDFKKAIEIFKGCIITLSYGR